LQQSGRYPKEDHLGHEQGCHSLVGLDLTPIAGAIGKGDITFEAAKKAGRLRFTYLVVREERTLILVVGEQ
jgi:hypothetical protein